MNEQERKQCWYQNSVRLRGEIFDKFHMVNPECFKDDKELLAKYYEFPILLAFMEHIELSLDATESKLITAQHFIINQACSMMVFAKCCGFEFHV